MSLLIGSGESALSIVTYLCIESLLVLKEFVNLNKLFAAALGV